MNKKNILILLIVLFNQIIFAQQGWYNLNVSFGIGGDGICFKDLNNGIIGNYKTTNAGGSWIFMGNNTSGSSLSFPAQNTGYGASASDIYKTTNFGDNWVSQINPSNQILNSINFPNVNTGYACGGSGKVIKTTNGGINWLLVNNPLNTNYNLFNVIFADSETGYISGHAYLADTSVFMKTTNGGNNWTTQLFTVANWGRFTSMFFVNANTGFIGSVNPVNYILKTTNAGVNWNNIIIPTSNRINSLYFPSASTGYGACYGGQIVKTTNSGNNWFLQTTATGSILYSIFFLNNLTGYAAGDNNTVLKTTDGGGPPIGITPISNEVPKDFRLEQNYPNPFNPATKIRFDIVKDSRFRLKDKASGNDNVLLKVYDILGREVAELVNEQLNAGTYEVDWDAANYSSGVYYYKIQTSDFVETKSMILIK